MVEDRLGTTRAAFLTLGAQLPEIPSPIHSNETSDAEEEGDEDHFVEEPLDAYGISL